MFNCKAQDKYSELKTFWLEVNNILSTHNTSQADKLELVKIGWGGEDYNIAKVHTSVRVQVVALYTSVVG